MPQVDYRAERAVAVITFGNAPVNGLSHAVRSDMAAAFERAAADGAIHAVVLAGADGNFSAGADIKEFGTPAVLRGPSLRQLVALVESSAKPVIAAISGNCLGCGLELALAAHYRVAKSDAKLGLPEVKLGLLPGAGGTQRLPRLVGVETAINMTVSGEPLPAKLLAKTALLDRVVEGDPLAAAIEFAASKEVASAAPRRVRDMVLKEPNLEALCEFARNGVKAQWPNLPAPVRCIDAIEYAAKPIEEGLAYERRCFAELMESAESKSLRHAFLAERAASKIEGVPESTAVRPIARRSRIDGRPSDRPGCRHRRRHDGRRHYDLLPERRHSRVAGRDDTGSARQRHRAHRRHLRRPGEKGKALPGRTRQAPRVDRADAFLRSDRRSGHRHRSRV